MEIEIPLIVKLLYFGSVTGPDPRLWPDEMKVKMKRSPLPGNMERALNVVFSTAAPQPLPCR